MRFETCTDRCTGAIACDRFTLENWVCIIGAPPGRGWVDGPISLLPRGWIEVSLFNAHSTSQGLILGFVCSLTFFSSDLALAQAKPEAWVIGSLCSFWCFEPELNRVWTNQAMVRPNQAQCSQRKNMVMSHHMDRVEDVIDTKPMQVCCPFWPQLDAKCPPPGTRSVVIPQAIHRCGSQMVAGPPTHGEGYEVL